MRSLALESERGFGAGLGSVGMVLDLRAPEAPIVRAVGVAGMREAGAAALVESTVRALPANDLASLTVMPPTGDVGGPGRSRAPALKAWLERFGAIDMLTLLALDPSGIGAVLAVNLDEARVLTATDRLLLSRLAAHVTAARQLRDAVEVHDDATYARDGAQLRVAPDEVAEAMGEPDVGDRLRAAVLALGSLRRGGGRRALGGFTSRVDAKWTVLAKFDAHGDEFVVARRNLAPSLPLRGLTGREREVASYLALGHTLKEVAYELGLSSSTVRVLAARAQRRLGLASSKELAAHARAHLGSTPKREDRRQTPS
ncbi:MAG: helix-turn-helix transcriptional regulator [Polyangiaceae bacterium]